MMGKYWNEDMLKKIDEIIIAKAKDIVSRQEEVLEAFVAKYGYQPDEMVMCLDSLGSKWWVEYRPAWIKCEDRMPKKDGRYLVVEVFSGNDKWIGVSSLRNGVWDCLQVKYWKELPEAPNEGS